MSSEGSWTFLFMVSKKKVFLLNTSLLALGGPPLFTACNGNDGEGNENPHKSYCKRDRRENSFFHRFWLRGWRSYDAID